MDHPLHRYYHGLVVILLITLVFCFTLMPLGSNYLPNHLPLPHIMRYNFQDENGQEGIWIGSSESESDSVLITELVQKQRTDNEYQMDAYEFHPKLRPVRSFLELLPAYGGIPIRNMVVTTWRSGSTFLGDLMQRHPASYYHYEPLLPYGIKRIRKGPLSVMAINDLEKLMHCNYSDMDHYTMFGKSHEFLLNHNTVVWNHCLSTKKKLCFLPEYLSKMCEIFPFQNIKTVRLQTMLVEKLLKDPSLNLRVLLLVRDPRATIQSRHHRDWCPGETDCEDPKRLCGDLVSDYNAYKKFSKQYPDSFKVMRYEDLSIDIYNMSREAFDFFRLSYHEDVEYFLDTHTKEKKGGVSSTYRDSKTAPFHWRSDLDWEEINKIQRNCAKALRHWGYKLAHNASHVLTFDPIGVFESYIK